MKNVRGAEPTVGLRIGVYIRVSTQRQATEGDSLEAQRSETTKYIEYKKSQQGWEVASIMYYVDAGRSAKDQNRPELQRLKLDTAAGTLDMVVCFKLDRITRSLLDFVELWKLFSDHDVRVISLREDFDTSTVMGEAMVKLIMVFAELERQLTAERTIATMKDRVSRGLWNGGYIYGYLSDPDEPGRLIPDPEWAPIIKAHFFDAFEDLGSAGAVQRHLLKNGIRMPQRESRAGKKKGGKPFDKQQVIRILKNPVYIGQVKWGDEVCENAHEPIISKAQFDRVQRKLRQTIARRRNHKYSRGRCYPLRGLVRCACGAMMTPHGTVGRGKTYHYYKCTKQDHQGGRIACDAPAIPAEALEKAVSERVVNLGTLERDRECVVREALGEVDDSVRRLDAKAESVRRRLATVQTELQNLVGVLKQIGGSGLASVQEELAALEEERSLLRDQLQRLAQQKAPAAEKTVAASKFVESWVGVGDLLRQATPDEQRTILQHFVEVVEIGFDGESKSGSYALRLFPEVRSLDPPEGARNGEGTAVDGGDGDPVLTDEALFCEFDEKAPRQGLEPWT